jgi:peptidoglycan/LPS O-acetylase OafA/YrhL
MTDFFGVACDYGPLWSLAVEEHFYIAWPAVVHKLTSRRLAWLSASIVIGIPMLRAVSFAKGWTAGLDWYTWFVADGLAMGALLSILLRSSISRKEVKVVCGWLLGGSALLALVGAPFGILTRNRILGAALQLSIVHAFFAGVLLLFLLAGSGSGKRFVNNGVLRFLGYISYGLYLDHILVFRLYDRFWRRYAPQWIPSSGHFSLVLLRFFLAGGAAIAVAYISRRFYEERFLRMKDSLVPQPETQVPEPVMAAAGAVDSRIA